MPVNPGHPAALRTALVLVLLVLTCVASSVAAQEFASPWATNLSLGIGTDYATGTYGSGTRTNLLVVPITVEWRPLEWLDLQVGVPYIYQSNTVSPSYVIRPGSTQMGVQSEQAKTPEIQQSGKPVPSLAAGSTADYVAGQRSSQNGIGDLSLQAGVTFVQEGELMPQFRALVYLKCPTGDRDDGLGTGEFDTGVGLAASRSLGSFSIYIEGMWVFQGGSDVLAESGYTARDYLNYYGEIGYQATERLIPSVVLQGTTSTSDELGGTTEVRLKVAWKITDHVSLQGYAGTGLTTTSADFTGGAALFYNF